MSSDLPLDQLPSTFYRVTVKALILDGRRRLLLCVNDEGGYEIPGGGLEHGESLPACLKRELDEELSLQLDRAGEIVCAYSMRSPFRGVPVVRIAMRASVLPGLVHPGDSIVDYRYVTKEEFLALDLQKYEGPVQAYAEAIWASV